MLIGESYSERTKCPSADRRMPRQKISSDCWPHRITGHEIGRLDADISERVDLHAAADQVGYPLIDILRLLRR